MGEVVWYDGFGNKHHTKIIANYTLSNYPNFGCRSWVATFHPRKNEPVWLDIREIEEFIDEERT